MTTTAETREKPVTPGENDWMPLILDARQRIAHYLQPTPLHHYPLLSELLNAEVYVKHENHQPIGAFKVRGGINLIGSLSA